MLEGHYEAPCSGFVHKSSFQMNQSRDELVTARTLFWSIMPEILLDQHEVRSTPSTKQNKNDADVFL